MYTVHKCINSTHNVMTIKTSMVVKTITNINFEVHTESMETERGGEKKKKKIIIPAGSQRETFKISFLTIEVYTLYYI